MPTDGGLDEGSTAPSVDLEFRALGLDVQDVDDGHAKELADVVYTHLKGFGYDVTGVAPNLSDKDARDVATDGGRR